MQLNEEEVTYQKIQWLIDNAFGQGSLKYQESCMLESIRNAVKWLLQTGVLKAEKLQVKRNVYQTNFRLAPGFQQEAAIRALYERIAQFSGS